MNYFLQIFVQNFGVFLLVLVPFKIFIFFILHHMLGETIAHFLYVVDRVLFYLMGIELYIDVAVERITINFEFLVLYVDLFNFDIFKTFFLLLFV